MLLRLCIFRGTHVYCRQMQNSHTPMGVKAKGVMNVMVGCWGRKCDGRGWEVKGVVNEMVGGGGLKDS